MAHIDRLMWQRAFELMDQVEWMRRHAFQNALGAPPVWQPLVDVFESEDAFHLLVALPCVAPEDIQIALAGHSLIISGDSTRSKSCRDAVVRRLEIPSGRFERAIELPPGRFEIGPREHTNGCLHFKLIKLS